MSYTEIGCQFSKKRNEKTYKIKLSTIVSSRSYSSKTKVAVSYTEIATDSYMTNEILVGTGQDLSNSERIASCKIT